MNHVDLNNMAYAQGLAFILIEHMNNLPNDKCSLLAEETCTTCSLIRTWHHVGTLEYIISLVERGYFEYQDWWNYKTERVDLAYLNGQWNQGVARTADFSS